MQQVIFIQIEHIIMENIEDMEENRIKEFEEMVQTNREISSIINMAKTNNLHNLMWEFDKAPDALQRIFHQGGDEDFIILQIDSGSVYYNFINSYCFYSEYRSKKLNINVIVLIH